MAMKAFWVREVFFPERLFLLYRSLFQGRIEIPGGVRTRARFKRVEGRSGGAGFV